MTITEENTKSAVPRRKAWQFSLWTLMLIAAAIGAWTAYLKTLQEEASLLERLPTLREIARELDIKDPQQFAIVQQQERFQGDTRWRVYLPPGKSYRIAWTTAVADWESPHETRFPTATAAIEPGEHELELLLGLEQEPNRWEIKALVDRQIELQETKPFPWYPMTGSVSQGLILSSQQSTTSRPLIVYYRFFRDGESIPPQAGRPAFWPGLQLWIEEVKP